MISPIGIFSDNEFFFIGCGVLFIGANFLFAYDIIKTPKCCCLLMKLQPWHCCKMSKHTILENKKKDKFFYDIWRCADKRKFSVADEIIFSCLIAGL